MKKHNLYMKKSQYLNLNQQPKTQILADELRERIELLQEEKAQFINSKANYF